MPVVLWAYSCVYRRKLFLNSCMESAAVAVIFGGRQFQSTEVLNRTIDFDNDLYLGKIILK